jgi:catechol 2,3-dioxygenase-like lactoylglutathione lyase family enzyme
MPPSVGDLMEFDILGQLEVSKTGDRSRSAAKATGAAGHAAGGRRGADIASGLPPSAANIADVGALRVNHVSIHAHDLEESARFYEELFGMRRVATATFRQPVLWLALGDQQLHLFQRDDAEAPRAHHVAIDVDDFEAVYREAKRRGLLDGETWAERARYHPAGWVQMYIRDPAGNLVEVDWPDVSTLDPELLAELAQLEDTIPQEGEARDATLYTAGSA